MRERQDVSFGPTTCVRCWAMRDPPATTSTSDHYELLQPEVSIKLCG
jgi:hypothetical protein